ncbi:MAG: hypothetical protein ACRDN9_03620 [Streptosporangiaceae bacterium]
MAAATGQDASTWANKVLREMLIHGGRRRGFRLCHCAVLGTEHSGLLISGPTAVGKTDLALKLAKRLYVNVVTVDRGVIGHRHGGLAVGTLPFGLNIHRDTLADLGCLNEALVHRYRLSNNKHYLDVLDAQRHCRITLVAWAPVTAAVELRRASSTTQWQRLDHASVIRTIRGADSADTDPGYQVDWLGMGSHQASRPLHATEVATGWALAYRPDQPIPDAWVEEVAAALDTPRRNNGRSQSQQKGSS